MYLFVGKRLFVDENSTVPLPNSTAPVPHCVTMSGTHVLRKKGGELISVYGSAKQCLKISYIPLLFYFCLLMN